MVDPAKKETSVDVVSARPGPRHDPATMFLVAVSAGAVLYVILDLTSRTFQLAGFWPVMTWAHGLFAVAGWRLSRMGAPDSRLVFRCAMVAGVALTIGDVVRVIGLFWAQDAGRAADFVDIQQATVIIAMVVLSAGLLRFPVALASSGARARLRLDVATVMAAAVTVGAWVFELPTGHHDLRWALRLSAGLALQPGIFLLVIFVVVRIALSGRSPFTRLAARVLCGAAVWQALLQGIPDSAYQSQRYSGWLLAGNMIGSVLLAVGLRIQQFDDEPAIRETEIAPRPYSVLPYVALAATWVLASYLLIGLGLTWRTWLVCAGVGVTTALVISRQLAAFRHIAELLREREQLTARLTEQAFHDSLTGLPNRALFLDRVADLHKIGPVTVFLIDLNGFKPVNDTFGHAAGDRLLIEVGRRLQAFVHADDTAARLGGDEFAVVMPGHAGHRLPDLVASLHDTITIGVARVQLSASIGYAIGREGADDLLQQADLAMYRDKRARATDRSADLLEDFQPPGAALSDGRRA